MVVENFLLSQHFGIAAARYTEGTQRLRLTIEDRGLVSMLDGAQGAWKPRLTRDRLVAALSLMADCRLIGVKYKDHEVFYSAV